MGQSISDSQILRAALEVISREGYTGATTREIAAAAGINEVTLFRRFGNKKKLLMSAVAQEAADFQVAEIQYTGDLTADLTRIVQFYDELARTRGQFVAMLMTEMQRQPELLDVMDIPLSIIGRVGEILLRYQAEGKLGEEPMMEAFVGLVGPIFMAQLANMVAPQLEQRPFQAARYVEQYLYGRAV